MIKSNSSSPDRVEELRGKLRMIISHASGGRLSKPNDIDRSINDICVEISRHKNEVWKQAQESALKARAESESVTVMREALEIILTEADCIGPGKCTHWVSWHNIAREALARAGQ